MVLPLSGSLHAGPEELSGLFYSAPLIDNRPAMPESHRGSPCGTAPYTACEPPRSPAGHVVEGACMELPLQAPWWALFRDTNFIPDEASARPDSMFLPMLVGDALGQLRKKWPGVSEELLDVALKHAHGNVDVAMAFLHEAARLAVEVSEARSQAQQADTGFADLAAEDRDGTHDDAVESLVELPRIQATVSDGGAKLAESSGVRPSCSRYAVDGGDLQHVDAHAKTSGLDALVPLASRSAWNNQVGNMSTGARDRVGMEQCSPKIRRLRSSQPSAVAAVNRTGSSGGHGRDVGAKR